jgi:tetratricopeptide (TPR) repeat protein
VHTSRLLACAATLALSTGVGVARASSSSADELVRQARTHEAAHDEDVAVRRYMEALEIDPVNEDAWLGLGALRLRLGEAPEAERVYDAALARVPTLHRAIQGRARARWAQGRHGDAEGDLEAYAALEPDADALRELSTWYGTDGRTPAQLAVWRRLLVMAADEAAQKEARKMVRALVILVDKADPVSSPTAPDASRRAMAVIARRGG